MINRSEAARRRLLWVLPLLVLFETFSFYRGWLNGSAEVPLMHAVVVGMGLIFNGAVALVILLVYRSQFMKAFYRATPLAAAQSAAIGSNGLANS